jgi:hypothetical protein
MTGWRRTVAIGVVAVAGLVLAAVLTTAASSLSNQSVGLSSEPLTAGRDLAPSPTADPTADPTPDRTREPRPDRTPRPTATADPTAAPPVEDDHSGSGSDDSGSGGDDSGRGRGRGRGRGGDDDD